MEAKVLAFEGPYCKSKESEAVERTSGNLHFPKQCDESKERLNFMNSGQKGPKPAENGTTTGKKFKGFTEEERAAMKERIQELKGDEADGESAVLAKIAEMREPDRTMCMRLHSIIKASAPGLTARLWYGMPVYAKDGKVVCHFQDANKFKMRYTTLGFSDKANLDEGVMWPVAFALKGLTTAEEASIAALVKRAVS